VRASPVARRARRRRDNRPSRTVSACGGWRAASANPYRRRRTATSAPAEAAAPCGPA
jgi:hypothetical protein